MDHGLDQILRVLRADHHVAEFARSSGPAALVNREGEHVGGAIEVAVLAIQRPDGVGVHQLHRQVAVLDPGGRERGQGRSAELLRGVYEVQVDQGD